MAWIASSPWSWCSLIKTIIGQGGWQRFAEEEHFVVIELYSQTCTLTKQNFKFSISHWKLSLPLLYFKLCLVSSHSRPFWVFVLHLCFSSPAHTSDSLTLLRVLCAWNSRFPKLVWVKRKSPNNFSKLSPNSDSDFSSSLHQDVKIHLLHKTLQILVNAQ